MSPSWLSPRWFVAQMTSDHMACRSWLATKVSNSVEQERLPDRSYLCRNIRRDVVERGYSPQRTGSCSCTSPCTHARAAWAPSASSAEGTNKSNWSDSLLVKIASRPRARTADRHSNYLSAVTVSAAVGEMRTTSEQNTCWCEEILHNILLCPRP